MTEHELEAVSKAFRHVLAVGAPGLSEIMRAALVSQAIVRLQHQFNMPVPALTSAERKVEA